MELHQFGYVQSSVSLGTVHLSNAALAVLQGGDVDHDGDSR